MITSLYQAFVQNDRFPHGKMLQRDSDRESQYTPNGEIRAEKQIVI